MNLLSSRLYKAMKSPTLRSVKPSLSNYPSSASIEIDDPMGGKQILGSCNREQWYRRKGIPRSEEDNINWRLSAIQGDHLHAMMSELLAVHGFQMGIYPIAREQPMYSPSISLSGRVDCIAWDAKLDEPIGIEFKSVGDWKSKKCLIKPAIEHVMQSMLYLDYYKTNIPLGQKRINRWYIWYVARSEGWHLKGKDNSSPFTQLWDFYITLDSNGSPSVYGPQGTEHLKHLTIDKIKDRYKILEAADKKDIIPDRDFELRFSEERIAGLYKQDRIELKTHKTLIQSWLKKGGDTGKLPLELGDFQCRACGWQSLCWNKPYSFATSDFDLPKEEIIKTKKENKGSPEAFML